MIHDLKQIVLSCIDQLGQLANVGCTKEMGCLELPGEGTAVPPNATSFCFMEGFLFASWVLWG